MKKEVVLISLCLSTAITFAENNPVTLSDTINLKEVVVTGSRVPVRRDLIPVPVSVISRSTLEQSGETNILPSLLEQVPGLFVTSRGVSGYGVSTGSAGGITMRGFSAGSGQVLILIDGHPQYATIYGHPVADAYIASDAERVEVSRGATSVLYGSNAMGGAINIITRKATKDGNNLSARLMGGSYGTQRYAVTDTYRNGRLSGVVSGNYDRTNGHRVNSEFESFSFYGKAGYELAEEWNLTGNINITKANSTNPGQITNPVLDGTADVLRGMAGLSLENNYGITRGAANLYYNWGDHKLNDGYNEGGTPEPYLFKSTDYMGGLNLYQSVNLFAGNTITGGFDVKLYGGNAVRNPETEVYADHIKLNEVAGYLFAQQEVWRFMFNAGIRMENHSLYGSEWVPQAGISFRAANQTHLKFAFAKGFRTPNMRELYMFPPANEALNPERSLSYDFTVSQALLNNRMSLDLTLFYIKGDNIIQTVPIENGMQNQNAGKFINKGIEFSMNYLILPNLSFNSNYSYIHLETPINGTPRNKFYAGMVYSPGKFRFNLGTMVINKLHLNTRAADLPTSSYTLVNAQASYQALKWLNVFVKGDNILARKYETMLGYPMPKATFLAGVTINI